jgi:ring-1,2-phenylacetyl-CoA epoxidase subunit PaaC
VRRAARRGYPDHAAREAAVVGQLSATEHEALRDLLIACADTKLLMGYHYGEWTFGAPMLEAAVAHCSLAQGELGHVRLLHGILKAHFDVDPDYLVEQRPADEFAANPYLDQPLTSWAAVVAMTVVVDLAVTRVIHSLRQSSFAPLRGCAAKLLDEERYHIHHGQGWLRTLAADRDGRQSLVEPITKALMATLEWLGPPEVAGDKALVAAGVKTDTDHAVGRALLQDVAVLATAADLPAAPGVGSLWKNWTSQRRRPTADGPSDDVLYHLRGTKNAVFKQA